jgi:hypothetical protein
MQMYAKTKGHFSQIGIFQPHFKGSVPRNFSALVFLQKKLSCPLVPFSVTYTTLISPASSSSLGTSDY